MSKPTPLTVPTRPDYVRDPRGARFWQLAAFSEPDASEEDLVDLAQTIDPDAWRIKALHYQRMKSLTAAARVQIREAAKTAMLTVSTPAPRRKRVMPAFVERIFS